MKNKQAMIRFNLSILLALFIYCLAFAQYSSENFIRYTAKDGLSDNYVTSIQQDSLGFIWVGTANGLNRFDGHAFTNYFYDSPTGFLASSKIQKLVLFDEKELGIISNGGFQIINPLTMDIRNFFIPDSTPFVALRNVAFDVAKLKQNKFGLSTSTGFYVFNPDASIHFRYDAYGLHDYGNRPVRYGRQVLLPDKDVLVYYEKKGLAHYDPKGNKYATVDSTNAQWNFFLNPGGADMVHWVAKSQISEKEFLFISSGDSIVYYNVESKKRVGSPLPFHWESEFAWSSQIIPIKDSQLVVTGAYSGFYFLELNRSTGKVHLEPKKILPDYNIHTIFLDREKRLWIGTKTGVLKQTISKPLIEKYKWPQSSDRSHGFTDVMIHDSVMYLSRQNPHSGLIAVDVNSMKLIKEFDLGTDRCNIVKSMQMYYKDTIWMGTDGGLLWLATKTWNFGKVTKDTKTESKPLRFDLLGSMQSDGTAWMILQLGGRAGKYNVNTREFQMMNADTYPQLPFFMIKHIAYDLYGDVWLGGHSLARWNHQAMQFDTLIKVYDGPHKYNENILTMVADDAGSLWMHNLENGLLQYKIREKSFRQFNMKDGLPTSTIIALSPVIKGYLFIMTPHHIVRMDTRKFGIEIFGNETDLPEEISITRNMRWDEKGKKMYAFYQNEIVRFPLERPPSAAGNNEIIVQEIEINNEAKIYYPGKHIKLKHTENTLAINYTIIDFEQSNDYQFAYNLDNAKEWTSVGSQRVIHFTDLSPGEHNLQIRATGKSGRQKVSHFNFIIQRPFWNQAWFFPLIAVLIAMMIYIIFRVRESRIREKANLDRQIAEAEMKALHAQMNPHFIFNSLNSIREMIVNKETDDASTYLSVFAQLIRMTLDQSNHSYITLRSTLEYLKKYVEMEKIRTEDFNFRMTSEEDLDPDETILPPMLIQPFIENAIWHGVNGYDRKLQIDVTFKKQNDQLVCVIEDDGIGILHSLAKKKSAAIEYVSVSIGNIEKRIELLNKKYNLRSTIRIEDKSSYPDNNQTGTKVTISLPLETEDE